MGKAKRHDSQQDQAERDVIPSVIDLPQGRDCTHEEREGSRLNLIEVFFSKLTRSLLRAMRVQSRNELVEGIHRCITQMNHEPVVFTWRYKMSKISVTQYDALYKERSTSVDGRADINPRGN